MIKYPYLGYGDIEFFLQNPTTGRWVLVHVIRYANTTATLQLTNPTLQFMGFTMNSNNTTNKTMYCGSFSVFISGVRSFDSNPKWAADTTKTGVTAEVLGLSLRNCVTYNGVVNRGLIRLQSIGFGTNANTYGVVRARIGATIGGSPVYNPVSGSTTDNGVTITSGNSITSVDTAGTLTAGYEREELMEMAMSNQKEYLSAFRTDLEEQRYAFIVVDPLKYKLLGRGDTMGEENNAWVRRVMKPILCNYQLSVSYPEFNLAIYVPQEGERHCP